MEASTIVEHQIGDFAVRAECSTVNASAAKHVVRAFERVTASGSTLEPGTQIRFGWSLLRLVEDGDAFRVSEPDFARWPQQRWVGTIDVTLEVVAAQTRLLQRLEIDGDDVFFDQLIIAARGALSQPKVFLRRTSSMSPEDSGWLLATVEDPEALSRDGALESVPTASLVDRRPTLLQALVLPPGFVAIFSGEVFEQILDSAGRPCLPGADLALRIPPA